MIVYCEECGQKNTLTPGQASGRRGRITCAGCGDALKFKAGQSPSTTQARQADSPSSHLVLTHGDTVIELRKADARLTLGRHKTSDLRVTGKLVSRSHAFIEYSRGRFLITDQSLNGTYILSKGRAGVTLKNDTLMLINSGIIGLGGQLDPDAKEAIHFAIVTRLLP